MTLRRRFRSVRRGSDLPQLTKCARCKKWKPLNELWISPTKGKLPRAIHRTCIPCAEVEKKQGIKPNHDTGFNPILPIIVRGR